MSALLEFARGPLFRLCFVIMVLGLGRIVFLDLWGIYKSYLKAGDKKMPWKLIFSRTLEWIFPLKRIAGNRHLYSIISIVFHIGLILVPVFLYAHIHLWKESLGVSWPALSYWWAFWLTLCTIVTALFLLIGRMVIKGIRSISRAQDYLWLLLLLVPFVTGFVCANLSIAPGTYRFLMVTHVLFADLIFILIPFTKIAHCVLTPFSQVVGTLGWKFPAATDDDILKTLNAKY